jgi:hypothetical protein
MPTYARRQIVREDQAGVYPGQSGGSSRLRVNASLDWQPSTITPNGLVMRGGSVARGFGPPTRGTPISASYGADRP